MQTADAHQTLHAVPNELKVIAHQTGLDLATVKRGGPEAWAQLDSCTL